MLELEGMSPTLPEWSTLLRGLLRLSHLLTLITEATTEAMLDMVWDTVGSMVPALIAMVWVWAIEGCTEGTEDTTMD